MRSFLCFATFSMFFFGMTNAAPINIGFIIWTQNTEVTSITDNSGGNLTSAVTDDTTKYRTATYRDWADAKDQRGKRRSIKCRADKVEFALRLYPPYGDDINCTLIGRLSSTPSYGSVYHIDTLGNRRLIDSGGPWLSGEFGGGATSLPTYVYVEGICPSKRPISGRYEWLMPNLNEVIRGKIADSSFILNQPRNPMPNLHNVGEAIYGGVRQTPVSIVVGARTGAHSVIHNKYKDVLKSFIKIQRGIDLYHNLSPRCLNTFDKNHKPISKQQKYLPPDKHNNSLFAEQLALKLNVAASDSGFFPVGLGDLIYNHSTPFDGMSVRNIIMKVDSFLSCSTVPPNNVTDPLVYLNIINEINTAFSGPIDTISWDFGRVICTGVKKLNEVTYLHQDSLTVPSFGRSPGIVTPDLQQPQVFVLSQNYPNPFNPITTISISLPEDALITLKVYNMIGQEVAILIDKQEMEIGEQEFEFDAGNYPSGIYFYRLEAVSINNPENTFVQMKKMVLIK